MQIKQHVQCITGNKEGKINIYILYWISENLVFSWPIGNFSRDSFEKRNPLVVAKCLSPPPRLRKYGYLVLPGGASVLIGGVDGGAGVACVVGGGGVPY